MSRYCPSQAIESRRRPRPAAPLASTAIGCSGSSRSGRLGRGLELHRAAAAAAAVQITSLIDRLVEHLDQPEALATRQLAMSGEKPPLRPRQSCGIAAQCSGVGPSASTLGDDARSGSATLVEPSDGGLPSGLADHARDAVRSLPSSTDVAPALTGGHRVSRQLGCDSSVMRAAARDNAGSGSTTTAGIARPIPGPGVSAEASTLDRRHVARSRPQLGPAASY